MFARISSIMLASAMLSLTGLRAHESAEHTLEHLNIELKKERTPAHLYQRALAYRSLGQLQKAKPDLLEAIKLAPKNLGYRIELGSLELAAHNSDGALQSATQAMPLATTPEQRAALHMLRAEAYHVSSKAKPSLQACQLAFKEKPKGEIEWFLLRSENQRVLKLHDQRISNLKTGMELHPSAVLKAHWVDSMIDAGKFQDSLKIIDSELKDRRWKSDWQVKRARALYGLKQNAQAETALYSALAEIQQRLNPKRPDPLLLADQGTAHALLGNRAAAQSCLDKLRRHRAAPWITSPLESLLK
ncbi:hypothetical protein NT6N_14860 [Oceaniferula spumae]|uniref:Tetratricopeptide repeat protein n=1 Tax=Oceaniferula spumae TaxID=2979115 RepID=A0AAT9FKB5_9BACT